MIFFRRRKLLFKLKRLYNMRVTSSRIKNLSHQQVKWRENLHISWAKNNLHEPRRPNFEQLKMPINSGYKLQPITSTVTIQSRNQHQDEPFHPLSTPYSNTVRPCARAIHHHVDNKKAPKLGHRDSRNNTIEMAPQHNQLRSLNPSSIEYRLIWINQKPKK